MNMNVSEPYQEKVAYDSEAMPLYIRTDDITVYPTLSADCHWHRDIEFLYVNSGYISYNVNGNIYLIREGEAIFVNSQQLHFGYSGDGSICNYTVILLNPMLLCANSYIEQQYITTLLDNHGFPSAVLSRNIQWQSDLLDCLLEANRVYTSHAPGFELELQSCFYRIWLLLFRNMPTEQAIPSRTQSAMVSLKAMITYLQEHSAEKIRLDDIAAAGKVCQTTCFRLFRAYLNRSPIEFLLSYRLERGCELMRETELNLTEIAYKIGFSSGSYFAELFRRQYGCTPTQWRKKLPSRRQRSGHERTDETKP